MREGLGLGPVLISSRCLDLSLGALLGGNVGDVVFILINFLREQFASKVSWRAVRWANRSLPFLLPQTDETALAVFRGVFLAMILTDGGRPTH